MEDDMDEVCEQIERSLGERIRRVEDSAYSRLLMSRFRTTPGGIDWTTAREVAEQLAPPERARGANVPGGLDTEHYVGTVVSFLEACCRRHAIDDAWVAFVADDLPWEYEVQREAVPELLARVAGIPNHKYLASLEAAWCFMWSFGDDLFFGFAPPPRPPRRR